MLMSGESGGQVVWKIEEGVAWVRGIERYAVLDVAVPSAQPLVLERSSFVIWDLLSRSQSVSQQEIVEQTATQFGVSADEIAVDVVSLLNDLRVRGMIVRV